MKVCIVGSGSWGTALAIKSVVAGNDTTLYCRRFRVLRMNLLKYRENKSYLAGVILPDELIISSDLQTSIEQADIVLDCYTIYSCAHSFTEFKKICSQRSNIRVML